MYQINPNNGIDSNIDRNMPLQLTHDGIRQLFITSPNQQFILQIIKISENYSQHKHCLLSDGYCYIQCQLSGQAKMKTIRGQLQVFDVIRIHRQDIIILGLQRQICLQLCNVNILGMRLLCTIGQPVSYQMYFNNQFINDRGSNKIADGQKIQHALTLPQLLNDFPHVPSKWILKAKVVKKPSFINQNKSFLVITLMDDQQNTIQGVFFQQAAIDANKKLKQGRQYLFNNGVIKYKKNSVTDFQIKFTEQSQIIPIQTMKSNYQNIQNNITNSIQNIKQTNIQQIINNINIIQGKLITIIGKIYKISIINNRRKLMILDRNNDSIQIMLWEEIKDQVKQGITYIFENVKVKSYKNMATLNSDKYKTKIYKSPIQFEKQNTSQNNNNNYNSNSNIKQINSNKLKQIKQPNSLMNVSQLIQVNATQRIYKDVCGFLIINTNYMDIRHFFLALCPKCKQNQISAKPLMCRKCSHTQPSIKWNMKCHIMDEKQDLKCVMNEDLCEKIFKMSAVQGFKQLSDDPDVFKKKVNEISHIQGIFKIKLNPYKDTIYYNILQIYRNDSAILLKKAYKQLKNTMKIFINQKDP